jgi:hypothetical protein
MKLRILISDMQQEKGDIVTAHQTILSCLEYPLMKHEENDMVLKLSKLLYNYGCFEEAFQAIDAVLRVNPKNTVGLSIKNGLLKEMGKEYSDVEILERQPSKSSNRILMKLLGIRMWFLASFKSQEMLLLVHYH